MNSQPAEPFALRIPAVRTTTAGCPGNRKAEGPDDLRFLRSKLNDSSKITFSMNNSVLTSSSPSKNSARIHVSKVSTPAGLLLPAIDSGNDLLANKALTAPKTLVDGLLHRRTKAILAGSSKAGKTWLLLDLAVAVASGGRFLKWRTSPGRVLFINLEIQKNFFRQRLRTVMEKRGLTTLKNLDVWTLRGLDTQAATFLPELAEKVRSAGYSLIVIDPIYKLMVGRSENSSTGTGLLVHGIEQLMEKSGAAIVYAHHFTKGNQSAKKAMDRMSGSGVFARDADTIVTLTEHRLDGCFVVETTQRNMESPAPFVVEWNCPSMTLRDDLDPADLHDGKRPNERQTTDFMLSLLKDQPLTVTDWEKAASNGGVSRATFYRKLAKLKASGEVLQKPGTKTWYRPVSEVSAET